MRLCRTMVLWLVLVRAAAADVVCPDSSYVTVDFACTFTGEYRNGEPFDTITIAPNDRGESLASAGITIRVYLKNCQGQPLAGVPANAIQLRTGPSGCTCLGGNYADGPTDQNGSTSFTGQLRGDGCGTSLTVQADGLLIGTVPVRFNSPAISYDQCGFSVHDTLFFAQAFGTEAGDTSYSACADYNEDGYVDTTDLAIWGGMVPGSCTPAKTAAGPEEGQE